ncbi:MAG: hypothetical protein KJP25_07725 [Gammaproteobacteria bacterium]|nr:hypothetical protein [Gammaproteobacteria bacterium]NNM12545.1 hypothetical protein [Pseudomonadales bacterium]
MSDNASEAKIAAARPGRKLLGVAVLLLLAHGLLAGFFIATRIFNGELSAYELRIENALNDATGLRWDIEQLQLSWRGLNPVVDLQQLQARLPLQHALQAPSPEQEQAQAADANGEPPAVLLFEKLQFYVDLPGTLWHRQLRLFGLRAQRAQAMLERQAQGITLAGLQGNGSAAFPVQKFLQHLRYASLPQIQVGVLSRSVRDSSAANASDAPIFSVQQLPELALDLHASGSAAAWLRSRASASKQSPGDVQLKLSADGHWSSSSSAVRGYISLGGEAGAQWAALLGESIGLQGLHLEAWLQRPAFGSVQSHAKFTAASITPPEALAGFLPPQAKALPVLTDTTGELGLQWRGTSDYSLAWRAFSGVVDGRAVTLPNGHYSVSSDWLQRDRGVLQLDSIDFVTALRELEASNILPAAVAGIFDELNPDGTLRNIELSLTNFSKRNISLRAQIENLQARAWRGAPGVTGLSGELELDASGGQFRFYESSPFSVSFPKLYRKALAFRSARGEISWRMDGSRLLFESSDIALVPQAHDASLGVQFDVNARTRADDEPSRMRLRIGYTDAQLQNLLQYVPVTLPAGVRNWLADADARGPSPEGGFIYNGSLQRGDSENRVINVFMALDGASLNYARQWQRAEELVGTVRISPTHSSAVLTSAKIAAVPLQNVKLDILSTKAKSALTLDAGVGGSLGSALALLKDAPFGERLRPVIEDWRGGGALGNARLQLSLPLVGEQLAPDALSFNADIAGGSLYMPRLDLTLENMRGPLAYDLKRGLHSAGLRASVFGEPWDITMGPPRGQSAQGAANELYLAAEGMAAVSAMRNWLRLPVLGFASGRAAFALELEQNSERSELRVNSELRGVSIEAPLPFYKNAQREQPFAVRWDLRGDRQPMYLKLPGLLEAQFAFYEFRYAGGEVKLGAGPVSLNANRGSAIDARELQFYGSLPRFNFAAWRDAYDRYQKYASSLPLASSTLPPVRLSGRALQVRDATAFGQHVDTASVDFEDLGDDFRVFIDSELIKGEILLPTAAQADGAIDATQLAVAADKTTGRNQSGQLAFMPSLPKLASLEQRMRINLDHLHLAAPNGETGGDENDSMFRPQGLTPMAVEIRDFSVGERSWGAWQFLLSASDSAALLHKIQGNLQGLGVNSEADDGLLWAYDSSGRLNTALNATVSSQDLGGFLEKFLADPDKVPLRADKLAMNLALSWPGEPLDIEMQSLNGDVEVDIGSGRFYRASESATGFLKLLGLFNFDALLRRMQLDFRDVYKEGLSFDAISAELSFAKQRVEFLRAPIEVQSPSSKFILAGSVDLAASSIDAELVATMPVANNLPWIAALAGGLPIAAGTFIVTRVLGEQFDQLSSAVYSVKGPMDEPEVKFERLFDSKGNRKSRAKAAAN